MRPRPHKSFPLSQPQWAEQARAIGNPTPAEPTNPADQEESNALIRDFLAN
jgi:hypothetical protein